MNKIKSIEQLVNSYIVAKAIHEMAQENFDGKLKTSKEEEYVEDWISKDIPDIWKNLMIKFGQITRHNNKLGAILSASIEDIFSYKFASQPSVSKNHNDSNNIKSSFKSLDEFSKLQKVNLEDHTRHVFQNILETIEEKEVYGSEKYILAALLHDFGKNYKIREKITGASSETAKNFMLHPIVSSSYVNEILYEEAKRKLSEKGESSEIRETIKSISELVEHHHDKSNKWLKQVQLISNADHLARSRELQDYYKQEDIGLLS